MSSRSSTASRCGSSDLRGSMSVADYTIRPSRDEDVPAITAIYCHHVLNGVASFEEVPPEQDEIARRRGEIVGRGLPYLVAERAGRVVGYCYAGLFRPRVAYRFTVEDSVYVEADEIGRGLGRALLEQVIARCGELGYRQMIAVIGGRETLGSIRLHERLGFAHMGVLSAVGFKFRRWIHIITMQPEVGPGPGAPPGI